MESKLQRKLLLLQYQLDKYYHKTLLLQVTSKYVGYTWERYKLELFSCLCTSIKPKHNGKYALSTFFYSFTRMSRVTTFIAFLSVNWIPGSDM